MSRVVPSQVVELIDKLFPNAKDEVEGKATVTLNADHSIQLMSIVELTEQIPSELIRLSSSQYAEYISGIAAIRWTVQRWQQVDKPAYTKIPPFIRGLRQHSPVALIRQALAACPDESPSIGITELNFISDAALRQNLRLDISAANAALSNGEWKAATVLSGSVIEALMLWSLQQQPPANVSTAINNRNLKVKSKLEEWDLYHYIEVAAELKIIGPETATQCRLAKDFRNFIHPGRAQRLGQTCNRGTALSAVAAVEHVVSDLTR